MARRKASIPKLQVYNNALKLAYLNTTFENAITDRRLWGSIFESGIGTYLINQGFKHRFDVLYWRERNLEVDYILKKGSSVVAIEVKSNSEKRTDGLDMFRIKFSPKRAFIVGDGGIAPEEFMTMDINSLF